MTRLPEGVKLLSREPTEEMLEAAPFIDEVCIDVWRDMWDAAPSLAAEGEQKLERDAAVGNGTFSKGLPVRMVMEAAYRHAEYLKTPESEAERRAKYDEFQRVLQATSPLAPAESGTPETDALAFASYDPNEDTEYEVVPADFARSLERQRDDWRADAVRHHHEKLDALSKLTEAQGRAEKVSDAMRGLLLFVNLNGDFVNGEDVRQMIKQARAALSTTHRAGG